MKIAILSTDGGGGGAPRAMQRLSDGLSARGHAVDIIQATRSYIHPNSVIVEPDGSTPEGDDCARFVDGDYLNTRRTGVSNTFFSFQTSGFDLSQWIADEDYDVVNIHWSNFMLTPETTAAVIALGKPVVFTLHDMGHFTGGCHYSSGCAGYERDCAPCPQVRDDTLAMAPALIAAKRQLYRRAHVAAVAPSYWLADCAARSGVFESGSVHRVSNSLETELFLPAEKAGARLALGLDPSMRYILFGAHHTDEIRKGFGLLIEAIERLTRASSAAGDVSTGRLGLIVFGEATPEIRSLGIPVTSFGFIGDDLQLARIYNAADLVILPSLEDNQPNVMMEAMAAGVPVVAFAVGGMNDMIRDGINGRLVAPRDIGALAEAVRDLVEAPTMAATLGAAARRDILAEATLDHQATRYEALFETLLAKRDAATRAAPRRHGSPSPNAGMPRPPVRLPERVAPRVATADVRTERERFLSARAAEAARQAAERAEAERLAHAAAAEPRGLRARLKKLRRRFRRALMAKSGLG